MKLHTNTHLVEKSDNVKEKAFSIKGTAKAFAILSSGLYSDKILAIVRELSCNAYDGHVANGNTDVPFEVKLPSSIDPTFFVKDFGIGLNHQDVLDLYTTYFESTKSDSDDYIGALGLGSKSPFSYGPSFTVESRHGGMKRLYNAFIGEGGVPQIALLGEEKSDDPTGMTVSLATKSGDAQNFRDASRKALMYFNPMPKIFGAGPTKPFELKHTIAGTNWKVRQADVYAHMNGAYVVQGQVAYPIDTHVLEQNDMSKLVAATLTLDIDLFVPMGQVEMAASREALSYTPATIKNLFAAVEVAANEMRGVIEKQFKDCKTLWEAKQLHVELGRTGNSMGRIFSDLSRRESFKYKGKEIDENIVIDTKKLKNTQLTLMKGSRNYSHKSSLPVKLKNTQLWTTKHTESHFSFGLRPRTVVIVDDVGTVSNMYRNYVVDYKKQIGCQDQDAVFLLVIKGTSKRTYDQKEVDAILKQIGNPTAVYVSTFTYKVEKNTNAGGYYKPRKADKALLWTGFAEDNRGVPRTTFSRLCWKNAEIDLNDDTTATHYYVAIKRFTAFLPNGDEVCNMDSNFAYFKKLKLIPQDAKVYGLNEKQVLLAANNKAWVKVYTHATEAFVKQNKDDVLVDRVASDHVMEDVGPGVSRFILPQWDDISKKLDNGDFKQTIDSIATLRVSTKTIPFTSYDIQRAALYCGDKTFNERSLKKAKKMLREFNDMLNTHSMLRLVNWDKVQNKDLDMIVEYANFVTANQP